ncbi:MAG: hypothetical protein ABSE82_01795 [Nitrososphaerales archaeon]
MNLEEGPFPLTRWNPPSHVAIYGISTKREKGEYGLIYIGQSENLSELIFNKLRDYPCWLREAGDLSNLYIAFHYMPSELQEQRIAVLHDLIRLGDPVCNRPTV